MVKIWINDTKRDISLSDAQAYVLGRIINNAILSENSKLDDTDAYDLAFVGNRLEEEANIPWDIASDLNLYALPKDL